MKRREFLQGPALGACSAALVAGAACADETSPDSAARDDAGSAGTSRRRVRQSVMGWCFKDTPPVELAKHCQRIGLEAIEGIGSADYDAVTKMGVKISLVSSHGFAKGPLDPENHAMVEAKLRDGIDLAVRYGAPNVITFTGMAKAGISDAAARKNCLAAWKRVIPYAEQKGIGIVLEHLNSKDDSHPMKGHPGYWGDDLHLCADLVQAVGSPRFQLLFDIYHVQIMNGDLIRNVNRYHEIVGHYHTAGNPGRGELDDSQEIQYPAVIRAIMNTGYDGYIAQEFIPTSADPIASLEQAFTVCDV
ncbi:Hydroxypyruvate isomerase [Rubripirellula lacrimiformis]|uniref:Hydroxypyruvate isomerase n=1 Tax=Rubripirellula lacrimiformis TaxID=1930273 RepID=A0A517N6E2_9BACT|nr:TIM barrel protein [Rubripirellula lacrimiformis]QDT02705.1 Hydroxypyruvate isomerase [Rubripirellula lacrimiformis]